MTMQHEPAVAAIAFAIATEQGLDFLRLWNVGEFDAIRKEWPEAPQSVFIGADPTVTEAKDEGTDRDIVEKALAYLDPHLNLGSLGAPAWAVQLASILTGGDGCGAPVGSVPPPDDGEDDAAVDRFAAVMKAKLAAARAKGRGGWNSPEPGMQQRLSNLLREHVDKGDPRDVANLAMFLYERGESILPLAHTDTSDA